MNLFEINDVKLIKINSDYRLGDVVFMRGYRWQDSRKKIIEEKVYRDTIGRDYLLKKRSTYDFGMLKSVIGSHIKKRNYDAPSSDELVIHIRAGDVVEHEWFLEKNYIKLIDGIREQHPIKAISIVTCFVYCFFPERDWWKYSEKKQAENIERMSDLFEKLNSRYSELRLKVVSNENIDRDLSYLYKAKHVILDKGGFSDLIINLRRHGPRATLRFNAILFKNKLSLKLIPVARLLVSKLSKNTEMVRLQEIFYPKRNKRVKLIYCSNIGIGGNFGDLLAPIILKQMIKQTLGKNQSFEVHDLSLESDKFYFNQLSYRYLHALGSSGRRLPSNCCLWGTGIIPHRITPEVLNKMKNNKWDIRAVRGPLTRDWLKKELQLDCPEVYGDPGQLIGLIPEFQYKKATVREVGIIPHFRDNVYAKEKWSVWESICVQADPYDVIDFIKSSNIICSSSLHAIIIAEQFGKETYWIGRDAPSFKAERSFKYNDYYGATGRGTDYTPFVRVEDAVKSQSFIAPQPSLDRFLEAFPVDLFE